MNLQHAWQRAAALTDEDAVAVDLLRRVPDVECREHAAVDALDPEDGVVPTPRIDRPVADAKPSGRLDTAAQKTARVTYCVPVTFSRAISQKKRRAWIAGHSTKLGFSQGSVGWHAQYHQYLAPAKHLTTHGCERCLKV